jgi:hypothetical protein
VTVEFQRGKPLASVKRLQMRAAGAAMLIVTPQAVDKTPRDCVMLAAFMMPAE